MEEMHETEAGQSVESTAASFEMLNLLGEEDAVKLNENTSDLHLNIGDDGYSAARLVEPLDFCYCWAGVKASHGITRGKAYFECKLNSLMPVSFATDHVETHLLRVGWSMSSASLQLGEESHSFGYGGTGEFSTDNTFTSYGETFDIDDVIGGYLDLDSRPPQLSYSKNGKHLGVAHSIRDFTVGVARNALFPHVFTKNIRFKVNLGQEKPWYEPQAGYRYIMYINKHDLVQDLSPAEQCEIVMMIGLPGAGKTTWAREEAASRPEKHFCIVGTDSIMDKMEVEGLPRENNYNERYDVLIKMATKLQKKCLEIASKKKRNVILDQTNVYPSARRRKMAPFDAFFRRAVVIVPEDAELERRSKERTDRDGKSVPERALRDMKRNFCLPSEDDPCFDAIDFVELGREGSMEVVNRYNRGGSRRPRYSRHRQQQSGNNHQSHRLSDNPHSGRGDQHVRPVGRHQTTLLVTNSEWGRGSYRANTAHNNAYGTRRTRSANWRGGSQHHDSEILYSRSMARENSRDPNMDQRYDSRNPNMDQRYDSRNPNMDHRYGSRNPNMDQRYDSRNPNMDQRYDSRNSNREQRYDSRNANMDQRYDSRNSNREQRYDSRNPNRDRRYGSRNANMDQRYDSRNPNREQRYDSRNPNRDQRYDSRNPNREQRYDSRNPNMDQRYDSRNANMDRRNGSGNPKRD